MRKIQKIGLIVAMNIEAKPIIKSLNLEPEEISIGTLPFLAWTGEVNGTEIMLMTLGADPRFGCPNIGTNAAVLCAQKLIEIFQPDILLNIGTAGGMNGQTTIGKVYLAQGDFYFHDRHIEVEMFRKYADGKYPAIKAPSLAMHLDLPVGILSTGNSFELQPLELERMKANNVNLKDMEAAAIAWVAWLNKTPCLALKAVTDFIEPYDHSSEAQFLKNYKASCERLSETTTKCVSFLAGRSLNEI